MSYYRNQGLPNEAILGILGSKIGKGAAGRVRGGAIKSILELQMKSKKKGAIAFSNPLKGEIKKKVLANPDLNGL